MTNLLDILKQMKEAGYEFKGEICFRHWHISEILNLSFIVKDNDSDEVEIIDIPTYSEVEERCVEMLAKSSELRIVHENSPIRWTYYAVDYNMDIDSEIIGTSKSTDRLTAVCMLWLKIKEMM